MLLTSLKKGFFYLIPSHLDYDLKEVRVWYGQRRNTKDV
jgi:hypothetical protein